jgi:CMP-N-acetylneuraminic acid synthetase
MRYRGFTLLEYSIAAARLLLPLEDVWVSTDSEEYADLASSAGASIRFIRPAEIAQDDSTDFQVFSHAIEFERLHDPEPATYWLHLRPTTPMRDPSQLIKAIRSFLTNPNRPTALRSVQKTEFPALKWCVENDLGFLTGLSGDSNLDLINLPRQSYAPVLMPNGYVDIIKSENVINGKFLHGDKCLGFLTPTISDIDTIEDLAHLNKIGQHAPKLEAWINSHYGFSENVIPKRHL